MVKKKQQKDIAKTGSFEQKYPHISEWIKVYGWIEIGQMEGPANFILAVDEGGMVWEGKAQYATIDDALADCEKALAREGR